MRGLRRIDFGRDHAWQVRISLRGKSYKSRRFPDKRYGGKDKAKAAAVAYLQAQPQLPPRHAGGPLKKYITNTSGAVGVCRLVERKKQRGWMAYWNHPANVRQSKNFRFSEYGAAAKDEAIKCRQEAELQIRTEREVR